MHSLLLLTQEQSRDEEYALVQLNLQAEVAEEYPVVELTISVSTFEWFTPVFNEPFARRSYLNLPTEDPLSEGGLWAKMTASKSEYIKKVDIGYLDDNNVAWGGATSSEAGVADTYYVPFMMGPDTEVACQPLDGHAYNQLGITDLYLNIQNPGTNNPEYYRLRLENTTLNNDVWTIAHVAANQTVTVLATVTPATFSDWDWMMFRRAGTDLSGWLGYYGYADENLPEPPGYDPGQVYGPWVPIISVTDATITEAGYVGFGADGTGQVHNFFAGDAYTDKQDAGEIYVDITVRSQEGIPGQAITFTFEEVEDWLYFQTPVTPANMHYAISSIHATDGATSLKLRYETDYPVGDFLFQWEDTINGGNTATTYWLSYTFMVESWAQIEKDGITPNGGFYLPGMECLQGFTTQQQLNQSAAPFVQALTTTTGQVGLAGTSQAVSEGVWHTIILGMSDDGVNRHRELWVDNVKIREVDDALGNVTTNLPYGISMGNENITGGAVWIDQMKWSFGSKPAEPTTTETAPGTSTQQWAKIREKDSGAGASVGIEIDPTYTNQVTEAWVYLDIYVPQNMVDNIAQNDSRTLFWGEWLSLYVNSEWEGWPINANVPRLRLSIDGDDTFYGYTELDANFVGDRWLRIEYHHIVGTSTVNVWIDGNLTVIPLNMTYPSYSRPEGFNFFEVENPAFINYGIRDESTWVGVDNMAYSTRGRVNSQQYDEWWSFEGADALTVANTNYPTPAFYAYFGPGGDVVTLEESMQGGGPGLPLHTVDIALTPSATEVVSLTTVSTVYLNLTVASGGTYVDAPTVEIRFSVLGGECYSTFSADQFGEGEASIRWSGLDSVSWSTDDNLRWYGTPSLADSVHC